MDLKLEVDVVSKKFIEKDKIFKDLIAFASAEPSLLVLFVTT